MKGHPHHIHRPIVQPRHVGADDGRREQRNVLKRVRFGGSGSLEAGIGSLVEALLGYIREGGAARVGVVHAAICTTLEKSAAVQVRGEGEDVEGGDGVDGVV